MRDEIKTIDEYISQFPDELQGMLQELKRIIKEEAPEAKEKISYQMPTFHLGENLVHFAAFQKHIGFYPTPSAIKAFEKELAAYKTSKGAIQFPIDKPLPFELIQRIVRFRVGEAVQKKADKSNI